MSGFRKIAFIVLFSIFAISGSYAVYQINADYESKALNDKLADMHQDLSFEAKIDEDITTTATEAVRGDENNENAVTAAAEITDNNESIVTFSENEISVEAEPEAFTEDSEPVILDSMKPFYNINTDTAGWLTVGGTKIDNIVVQASNNGFYLDHDFYKNISQPGTLFADYRCNINNPDNDQSDVVTIYGHNQKIGTMFGTLDNYKNNLEFYKSNPVFEFSSLYEKHTYKIISMFVCKTSKTPGVKDSELFLYHDFIDFDKSGRHSFQNWSTNIKGRSQIEIDVDMQPDDKYIALSTCSYEFLNARFVVVGRRVREGESVYVNTDSAVLKQT